MISKKIIYKKINSCILIKSKLILLQADDFLIFVEEYHLQKICKIEDMSKQVN